MSQTATLAPADAFALAMTPMRERRWADAEALWRVFREQYKGHPAPWFQGATSLLRQAKYAQAQELLEYSRLHFAQHAGSWLISAECARLQGHLSQEAEFLAQGRELHGSHWELFMRSADLELRLGQLAQAEVFNSQARRMVTGRVEPWAQYAEIAEKKGDWVEAQQRWEEVIHEHPTFTHGYNQIALAHKQMGNLADARRYRLAAQYGPDLLVVPSANQQVTSKVKRETGGLAHFLQLVNTKAVLNLKSESARTYLNYAWVIIEPLLHLIIYYFLFGRLLNAGVENYGLFLLCGLVPWMWFSKAISTGATSIIAGQGLMLNSNVTPEFFPLVSVLQATYKQLPALLLLLLLGVITDEKSLSWSLVYLPLIIVVQFLLTVTLGMLVAAIIPFARDLANLIGTGLTLLMFLSGVIYNYQALPGKVGQWVQYNPVTPLIAAYRDVILQGNAPNISDLGYVAVFACVVGVLNFFIYKKQRRNFVRRGMA